jgi:hypothetical protein
MAISLLVIISIWQKERKMCNHSCQIHCIPDHSEESWGRVKRSLVFRDGIAKDYFANFIYYYYYYYYYFCPYWGLNSEFSTCKAGALLSESHLHPFFLVMFEIWPHFLPRPAWTMHLYFMLPIVVEMRDVHHHSQLFFIEMGSWKPFLPGLAWNHNPTYLCFPYRLG